MTPLTPAQKRALEWLPSDGRWRTEHIGIMRFAAALFKSRPELVERQVHETIVGNLWRYRLTPAGITLKAELFP